MKIYFCKKLSKPISFIIFIGCLICFKVDSINADYLYDKLEINSSTKAEEDSSVLPTNPFEIVEMMRRYNSLNNATNPSDALDDALESFDSLEVKEEI